MKRAVKIAVSAIVLVLIVCAVAYGITVTVLVNAAKQGIAVNKWLHEDGPFGTSQMWESSSVYIISAENDNGEYQVSGYVFIDNSWHKFDSLNSRKNVLYFCENGYEKIQCSVFVKDNRIKLKNFYDGVSGEKLNLGEVTLNKCDGNDFRLPFAE